MNYISLGYFCSVSMQLEKLGLRDASYPFDWNISDFKGVIEAIDNNFQDFIEYKFLAQNSLIRNYYKNTKYEIQFFHDFTKYKSLEKQLPAVEKKYARRIKRFYETIKEPTVFLRYISDESLVEGKSKELIWIENNYDYIMNVIKRYNRENSIIFIANEGVRSEIIEIHNVTPDAGDHVARYPLEVNESLQRIFSNIEKENREKNIQRYEQKLKKEQRLYNRIYRKVCSFMEEKLLREYVHKKLY